MPPTEAEALDAMRQFDEHVAAGRLIGETLGDTMVIPWVRVLEPSAKTALLRALVLLCYCEPDVVRSNLWPAERILVKEGARVQDMLPDYITLMRANLSAHLGVHSLLIEPLLDLVMEYASPVYSIVDLWATGLGNIRLSLRQEENRPHSLG
jgi:hypothetical protein